MAKFKKKPVVIEAIQLTKDNFHEVESFIGYKTNDYRSYYHEGAFLRKSNPIGLHIKTLEGTMTASVGDWIIKGVNGEFYPCKPDIFEKTYETACDSADQDKGEISDGYHTFNELYIHRHALFINVINAHQDKSFKTHRNDAGEQWEGWFIAGLNTRFGQITYHLPIAYWDSVNAIEVDSNSDYDGHSAADVAERLLLLAGD